MLSELDALATEVLDAARSHRETIATAESLTGGLIAATLTRIPGASDVFVGATVAYTLAAKARLLDLSEADVESHGVYSEWTATQMAQSVQRRLGTSIGVACSGVAGPGSAGDTPAGEVHIAVARHGVVAYACCHFSGSRHEVRQATVREALAMLLTLLRS